MAKSIVAILKTTPTTVVRDYGRLMRLAKYKDILSSDLDTLIKINISWHHWYPACSTAPWQYEGVVAAMLEDGFRRESLIPTHNRTVVVDDKVGIKANHYEGIDWKYNLVPVHTYEPPITWNVYRPKSGKFRVLDGVYPDGVKIPDFFIGKNIIQMPTVKTHVFTTITGAMKNAFGGLLSERRHFTHAVIHETLVDLLRIQKEIHPGLFAVMDGTLIGDGPGPRCMRPAVGNVILASADQVAIDAVSAKIQGFDPLSLKFIRCAHEDGLGVGDPRDIEIVGMEQSEFDRINFHHKGQENTFASRGQKMIYHGPLKPLEGLLLRTWVAPWSYAASRIYHDLYWYPVIGKERVNGILATDWGKLFRSYSLSNVKKREAEKRQAKAQDGKAASEKSGKDSRVA